MTIALTTARLGNIEDWPMVLRLSERDTPVTTMTTYSNSDHRPEQTEQWPLTGVCLEGKSVQISSTMKDGPPATYMGKNHAYF